MSTDALTPAIHLLERKVNALLSALNVLRGEAGMSPYSPSPGSGGEPGLGASLEIRADTFFNKVQHTAMREYLEMRRAHGLGPAKPREIFEALKAGGFHHEAKADSVAMVGLRALLRRRTNVFIKVGDTGAYGLVSQYGRSKPAKEVGQAQQGTDPRNVGSEEEPDVSDDEDATAAEGGSSAAAA